MIWKRTSSSTRHTVTHPSPPSPSWTAGPSWVRCCCPDPCRSGLQSQTTGSATVLGCFEFHPCLCRSMPNGSSCTILLCPPHRQGPPHCIASLHAREPLSRLGSSPHRIISIRPFSQDPRQLACAVVAVTPCQAGRQPLGFAASVRRLLHQSAPVRPDRPDVGDPSLVQP